MGQVFSKAFHKLVGKDPVRIIMVGLDAAGMSIK